MVKWGRVSTDCRHRSTKYINGLIAEREKKRKSEREIEESLGLILLEKDTA